MRFVKMENGLPKRENFKLKVLFNEFIAMNVKVSKVELDPDDYKSISVAYSVLGNAARRHAVPVQVRRRNGEIYFVRKDM